MFEAEFEKLFQVQGAVWFVAGRAVSGYGVTARRAYFGAVSCLLVCLRPFAYRGSSIRSSLPLSAGLA